MSSDDLALRIRGLSKSYTIVHNAPRHTALSEAIMERLRNPIRRLQREKFWALNDIEFDVKRGEVVGIIGRNGAGKSTLLKVLSRITAPTQGEIEIYGRVGSLLEVGTGFHAELTGRENIYLNGAILGMKHREISRQFDAIVEFAGVEKFLDTPVKRYSSGMYVRLAFAVAAHLNPEILIVDEVLAVGDMEFQKKCLGAMRDVATSGRTVLFVSHNMHAVSTLCSRGIFLRGGRVVHDGDVQSAVNEYMTDHALQPQLSQNADRRAGTGEYRFTEVAPAKEVYAPDEEKVIRFRVEHRKGARLPAYFSGRITDEMGAIITQFDSRFVETWMPEADVIEGALAFKTPWLKPGSYRIRLNIAGAGNALLIDECDDACTLTVSPILPYAGAAAFTFPRAIVLADYRWEAQPAPAVSASDAIDRPARLPAL
jgi:lipopolysaccharide transport system ATP-binding protein